MNLDAKITTGDTIDANEIGTIHMAAGVVAPASGHEVGFCG